MAPGELRLGVPPLLRGGGDFAGVGEVLHVAVLVLIIAVLIALTEVCGQGRGRQSIVRTGTKDPGLSLMRLITGNRFSWSS